MLLLELYFILHATNIISCFIENVASKKWKQTQTVLLHSIVNCRIKTTFCILFVFIVKRKQNIPLNGIFLINIPFRLDCTNKDWVPEANITTSVIDMEGAEESDNIPSYRLYSVNHIEIYTSYCLYPVNKEKVRYLIKVFLRPQWEQKTTKIGVDQPLETPCWPPQTQVPTVGERIVL